MARDRSLEVLPCVSGAGTFEREIWGLALGVPSLLTGQWIYAKNVRVKRKKRTSGKGRTFSMNVIKLSLDLVAALYDAGVDLAGVLSVDRDGRIISVQRDQVDDRLPVFRPFDTIAPNGCRNFVI